MMRAHPFAAARLLIAAAALVASLTPSTPSWAGQEEAIEYYNQALDAYQKGELENALQLLRRAYAEEPELIYMYNQILVLRELKRYQEALDLVVLYENPMKEDEQKRFSDISEVRKSLEEAVAAQQAQEEQEEPVVVKPEVEEDPITDPPLEEVDPGSTPLPVVPPPSTITPEEDEPPDWLAWSLVGGGALLTGTGALFGSGVFIGDVRARLDCATSTIQATSRLDISQPCFSDDAFDPFRDADGQPPTDYTESAHDDDLSTVDTHQTLAIVFLGTGLAAATTGVILLLIDGDDESAVVTEDGVEEARRLRPTLSPYVHTQGAGAVFTLDF